MTTAMVEVLGRYSKQRSLEIPLIALIEEARQCQREAAESETPAGIRNSVRARVRVLSPEEIDELAAAYKAGDSTYDLSRRFGIRRDTASAHLQRLGIMLRVNRKIVLDSEIRSRVSALSSEGWSVRRIAQEVQITERVIARTLAEARAPQP